MKMMQQDTEFSPVALVLETQRDAEVFWDMVMRIQKCTTKDEEYAMAVKISDWFSNNAVFGH